MIHFLNSSFLGFLHVRRRFSQVIEQIYFIAVESSLIIFACVSFAAIVTVLESSFHMKLVIQGDSMVPGFSALLILDLASWRRNGI
jgi:phospholipid/cholesterol/gamma-HCH transport system permease protein